jgi:hypothetical protein
MLSGGLPSSVLLGLNLNVGETQSTSRTGETGIPAIRSHNTMGIGVLCPIGSARSSSHEPSTKPTFLIFLMFPFRSRATLS